MINVGIWMFPKRMGFPPKSSILIGFSIINHPFWDTHIFGNTQVGELTIQPIDRSSPLITSHFQQDIRTSYMGRCHAKIFLEHLGPTSSVFQNIAPEPVKRMATMDQAMVKALRSNVKEALKIKGIHL